MINEAINSSNIDVKNGRKEEDTKLNSLLIALALSTNYISAALNTVIRIPNLIIIINLLIFVISFIRNNLKIKIKQIKFIAITVLPVFLSLIIGDISNKTQIKYVLGYMMNATLIVYLVSFKYDFNRICKFIGIIFTSLIWTLLFFDILNYDSGSLMGWSYSVVPFFLSSIYYFFYCDGKRSNKLIMLLSNFIYIFWIYRFISRGPVLAIVLYIYILYILNSKKNVKFIIIILFSFIIFIFLLYNFKQIVIFINNFLLNYDINLRFLNKTILLLNEGRLDNGRFNIYKISWDSFKTHPILGNGIAALDRLYGLEYDHSIILQLLNESGIIFTFIHIMIIIKGLLIIIRYWNKDLNSSRFLLFLLCNSLVRLLFSFVFWIEQGYWMFLYVAFAYKIRNEQI